MKHLPVPPLRQSLDSYLAALGPLSNARQLRQAEAVVSDFAATDGPLCQAELMRLAHREDLAGRSWLSQAWLSGYLANRAPLPMASSVGFRIRWDDDSVGIARAADVIHRVAGVHLAYLRGEIEDEINARGDTMDMAQWRVLAGGLRHPQPGEDVVLDGRPGAATREVVVLWKGRALAMPISDVAGQPLSRLVLADALHRLQELPLVEDDTFTHASYLGGDQAAAHLDALLEHPGNAAVHDRLVHAVFAVNLTDTPASEEEHQERVTFQPGQAWAHKPFTYQVSLVDDYVGVHVEHSVVDGGTLRSMISLMQQVKPVDGAGPLIHLEPLAWIMPHELRAQLAHDIASYERRAGAYRVRIVRFPMAMPPGMPFRVSQDAIQQFSLLYAQLRAYGRVRSTYEAADLREYQAGRTECLRPNTADALALVTVLRAGDATPDHLYAALAAHKDQVVTCKSGQGFSRHMLGLRVAAERLGLGPALFDHDSYQRLTTDFLSTTSVGVADQIIRFTFAPTSVGGLGVNYTIADGMYEFCLTYNTDEVEDVDAFIDGLKAGIAAIGKLLVVVRDN